MAGVPLLPEESVLRGLEDGYFAFLLREIAMPTGKTSADLKRLIVQDLEHAKIEATEADIALGSPNPKDGRFRWSAKIVGKLAPGASDWLKALSADPPLSHSILIDMPEVGDIGGGKGDHKRGKLWKLPFGGCGYKDAMLLRGAILPADHYNKQRLSFVKQQITPPDG